MFGSPFPDPSPCGAGSVVLKRAAWSSRAKPDDAVASIRQSNDPLHRDRLHAGLELQLPVLSCTCCLRPSPNAVGLLLLSFPPVRVCMFKLLSSDLSYIVTLIAHSVDVVNF